MPRHAVGVVLPSRNGVYACLCQVAPLGWLDHWVGCPMADSVPSMQQTLVLQACAAVEVALMATHNDLKVAFHAHFNRNKCGGVQPASAEGV